MRRFLMLGMLALVASAACTDNDDSDSAPSLAQWAAGACGIVSDWRAAESEASGGADPITLPLDERLERAERLGRARSAASRAAAERLDALGHADEVCSYHDALIRQFVALAEAEDVALATRATTAADLEAANAELNIVLDRTESEVVEAAASLPADATAALRGVNNCPLLREPPRQGRGLGVPLGAGRPDRAAPSPRASGGPARAYV
jgi:hypothetical protein